MIMGGFLGGRPSNDAASGVDPAGSVYQNLGSPGSQSTLGKAIMNDPVHNFLFGGKPAYVMPTAGPYAGVAPSLAGAQGGYALNSQGQVAAPGAGTSPQLQATFGTPAAKPLGDALAPAAPPMSGVPNTVNPLQMRAAPGQGNLYGKASY